RGRPLPHDPTPRRGCADHTSRPACALGRRSHGGQAGCVAVVEPLIRTYPTPPRRSAVPAAGRAVVRTALLNRLCAAADATIVTIIAPAGYGKTTLLSQWAERDDREVLRIDLAREDDDADVVGALLQPLLDEPGLLVLLDDVQLLRSRAATDTLERLLG